jgi:hypothetical protein
MTDHARELAARLGLRGQPAPIFPSWSRRPRERHGRPTRG